jgi:predicted HicB family RNase H-like nuclease
MEYKGYTARIVFDGEAGVLSGEVEGLRDVVTFEATNVDDLKEAFQDSVDDYLEMCAERGEEPEKPYSGKFLVRVDPRLHRDLAMAAAGAGKSLNAYTSELLKNWLVRDTPAFDARRNSPATANARDKGKGVRAYPVVDSSAVIADSGSRSNIYADWTLNTPGSITPSRISKNTPPAVEEARSRTPSAKPPVKKVA